MIKGEIVVVTTKQSDGTKDAFGALVEVETSAPIDNVLVSPTKPEDILANNRLNGSLSKYTLYFPKTFRGELRGAEIEIRGKRHRVIGDPAHYSEENTPGQWSMPVYVEALHG